jgi:small subunit ribosomal protein S6
MVEKASHLPFLSASGGAHPRPRPEANPWKGGSYFYMRAYELYIVFTAGAEESEVTAALDQLTRVVSTDGGEVTKVEPRGQRRLAYPVRNQQEGQDVILYFQSPAATIGELERLLKLNEQVLRYLVVRLTEES